MENQKDQAKEQTPGIDNDQEQKPYTILILSGTIPKKEYKPIKIGTFTK